MALVDDMNPYNTQQAQKGAGIIGSAISTPTPNVQTAAAPTPSPAQSAAQPTAPSAAPAPASNPVSMTRYNGQDVVTSQWFKDMITDSAKRAGKDPMEYDKSINPTTYGARWGVDASQMGPAPSAQPAKGIVQSAMPKAAAATAGGMQVYKPTTSTVDQPTETVQGQVNSILATDSPLMERARALATQQMAGRGLINSSMTAGAGVAAMTDRAIDIGSKDASIYGNRSMYNTDAVNSAGQFNAGQNNEMVRQQQAQAAQAQQLKSAQEFQAQQSTIDRAQQQVLQNTQQQFATIQSQLDRDQQTAMVKLQESLSSNNVSKTFAANTSTGILNAINAVQLDPNLTPEAKKGAIANIIAAGNSTMQWGSAFYNTPLPEVKMPTAPAAAPTAATNLNYKIAAEQ